MSAQITKSIERAGQVAARGKVRRRIYTEDLKLWIPAGFLVFVALVCFLGPVAFSVPSPVQGVISQVNLPVFSPGHFLGTDPNGFDELSRLLYGGRISLEVGLGAITLGLLIGGSLGGIAGLWRGAVETLIMRVLDMFLAFPALILAVTIAYYIGASEIHLIYALALISCAVNGRLARAYTIRLRDTPFVMAARLSGRGNFKILLRHIAPNVFPNLMTFGILGVGATIALEAALSFLGVGVPPPEPSWGNMIATGDTYLGLAPQLVIIPSIALLLTITALNMLSDALRLRVIT